ncbi:MULTISPECIES: SDR family NAD(P)-dependent oxidoreductase [Campylobacter]|uniref:Short-chain dehydrogenase/reductase n=1 Tax=Campylobacter curvus (strain 525.92) TaxID=360105 RepID=A7H047_CAMC5|nr:MULTISPECIES: SDR family NAD(P)-dependent oxidoreductase [Campylobacter]EAU01098.1 short-chain dehydrogenase/reductase [Campylobacter curvus 525.92]EJP75329.1 serine 3-dehydrogenase domain protein [Campylobacter sp. FOBRC14]
MKNTAFVTGATSGFGEEIARELSAQGYKIVALGRRRERLEKLALELGDTHIVAADVRDKDAIFDAVKNLPENFRDVEVLVNNAGLALGLDGFADTDVKNLEIMVDTNIKSGLFVDKKNG